MFKGNPTKSLFYWRHLGKDMSSLMGVDLANFVLRVRSLNLSPSEPLGVAERWCPFLLQQQICEGHCGVAIHFPVTKGERTQPFIP